MSTGILSTRQETQELRTGGRGRVAERSCVDVKEERANSGEEADDAEDQAHDGERSTAQRASACRDALARDEAHDRGRRAKDDAETPDGAHRSEEHTSELKSR